ncbi:hypothetical protein QFZ30_002121 [Arthrobacter pascens]|nr:hypothetical protein [Arthrobacter pascens]
MPHPHGHRIRGITAKIGMLRFTIEQPIGIVTAPNYAYRLRLRHPKRIPMTNAPLTDHTVPPQAHATNKLLHTRRTRATTRA